MIAAVSIAVRLFGFRFADRNGGANLLGGGQLVLRRIFGQQLHAGTGRGLRERVPNVGAVVGAAGGGLGSLWGKGKETVETAAFFNAGDLAHRPSVWR